MNFPEDVLNCNDYVLELEQSSMKKRFGIYMLKTRLTHIGLDINIEQQKDFWYWVDADFSTRTMG